MKKLTFTHGKAMACLVLMCLFLVQGCKKDRKYLSEPDLNKQLISTEVITKWQASNPAAEYFALDWKKARQAQIQGKNVVRVPLMDIDKISIIKGRTPKANSNLNYNEKRPPEVFFIQNGQNGKLHTYLLNFISKDNMPDDGHEGQQTGKLYEWNFSGDTIAVQNIEKGRLVEKYLVKYGVEPQLSDLNATVKQQKLQTINIPKNKLTSNIFTWLLDKVHDFIGWVGSPFGASTWVPNNIYGQTVEDAGWRINKINWASVFSTGNMEQIDYIAADEYGSGGGEVYASFLQYSDPNSYDVYPHGPNVPIQNFVADYVASKYQLDYDSRLFLYAHLDIAEEIRKYGEINPVGQEQIDFIKWAVGYQIENPDVLFKELIDNNELNITLPNLDTSELNNYPKFKALVNDLPNFIANYPNILKALSLTTGLTEKRIKELMQPGKGPKVIVINNLKDADGNDVVGQFDNKNKILKIDNGYVNDLDAANTPTKYQAIGLILTITTLHEFVHFGRDANNLPKRMAGVVTGKGSYEAGWYFEDIITAPGSNRLEPANAQEWLRYYRVKSRQ